MANRLRALLSQDAEIVGAAMRFNRPSLEEAAESLISKGASVIVVAAYFLFPGRHITEDIPLLIEKLRSNHPQVQFILTDNLGLDECLVELIAKRIIQVCPLSPELAVPLIPAEDIEKRSMDIIDRLLPPDLAGDQRTVVKRIVHTSGDPQIARLIKFSPTAISSGVAAIIRGSPIFTDVRMVASGISGHLVKAYGCSLVCALDEMNPEGGEPITRTARAMYGLGTRLDHAIVAIGNAPTALLALLDIIDQRDIAPALVIGMPVGFVQAKESKDELTKRDTPYITVLGTRGGSAMAAATVNALLKMVAKRNTREY